jgi:hypothetical protein
LCTSYVALDDWDKSYESCGQAISKPGATVEDFSRYVSVVLKKKGALTPDQIKGLDEVIAHLRSEVPKSPLPDELLCQVGARLQDPDRLQTCAQRMTQRAPSDPKTISYQWAAAIARKDYSEARELIDQARQKRQVPPEALESMAAATLAAEPWWLRTLRDQWAIAVAVIALLGLLTTVLLTLRRVRRAAGRRQLQAQAG